MTIGIMTDYMSPSALTEVKIYGEPAPGILLAPFSIPIYLDILLKQKRIAPEIFDTFWFRFSAGNKRIICVFSRRSDRKNG
jgi:hypothetical protein